MFFFNPPFVRPGQAESGFCFPNSHQDLWEQYQGRKDNPYFTMIKLFGGGGEICQTASGASAAQQRRWERNSLEKWCLFLYIFGGFLQWRYPKMDGL